MTSEKLLKHAQYYGKMGLRVFPCKPKEKVPATANGWKAVSYTHLRAHATSQELV